MTATSHTPDTPDTPARNPAYAEGQTAMQDPAIMARLEENPEDIDAQLDAALDASMDGSDPISLSQPARAQEPAPVAGQHGEEPEVRSNA